MESSERSELTASKKHQCPACGGECIWNPAKHALVCPYCGTTAALESSEGEIREHDLAAALRAIPDEKRGWDTPTVSVRCQHCLAISVFASQVIGQRCDFCGSSQLLPYEETKSPFRPESLLPLKIAESNARDLLKEWVAGRWFAPNNLLRLTRTDTVKGIYVPFWTFDANVDADWTAESGTYYYTRESYTDNQGNRKTRQVRHVRWTPVSGNLHHVFDDHLVPATKGIPTKTLDSVGPFPTQELVIYDPAYVKGWLVEHYQLDLVDAANLARQRMAKEITTMCAKQVPGDTHRALQVSPNFDKQTYKHILAPVWLLTYLYNGTSYQVVVNGVTGTVIGDYPKSWIKIALAVVGAIITLLIVISLLGVENTSTLLKLHIQ